MRQVADETVEQDRAVDGPPAVYDPRPDVSH
jgi:hypothetical protein